MALDVDTQAADEAIALLGDCPRPTVRAQMDVLDEMMAEALERDSALPWTVVRTVLLEWLADTDSPTISLFMDNLEEALEAEGCGPESYLE